MMEQTEWFNVRVSGKSVPTVQNYISRGTPLLVEGKLRTRKYTDQQGAERQATEVVCFNFQLLGSRPQQEQPRQQPVQIPAAQRPPMPSAPAGQYAEPRQPGLLSGGDDLPPEFYQ